MTQNDFLNLPLISSYFPIRFPNNTLAVSFSVLCGVCHETVPQSNIRGHVEQRHITSYREVSIYYEINAKALCQHCQILTNANYNLLEDLTLHGEDPLSKLPNVWKPKPVKPSILDKLFQIFK